MITYYREHKRLFLVFFVLTFLFYGNTLKNKFSLDDEYVTVTNTPVAGQNYTPNNKSSILGIKGIPKIWQSRYAQDEESSFEYRPVTTSSLAIEYSIFGQNPLVNHLFNVLLYFFTVCLLFIVLLKLFESQSYHIHIAFLTSLLFLIHPIHSEVVNSIKSRDELLALFFSLLALWYSLAFYQKANFKNGLLIILFLLLGVFSKKSAMIFLAIIPLTIIFYRGFSIKSIIACIVGIGTVYILAGLIENNLVTDETIRQFYSFENPMYVAKLSFFDKVIIAVKTLGFYVKFLIIPFPFRFYYGGNTFDVSPAINYYFFIALSFLALSFFYYFKTKNKLFLFGLLFFLGSIFPFLNFITPVAGILGERLAYIATIGFSIMIISLLLPYLKLIDITTLKNLFFQPKIYGTILIVVCLIYSINRNSNWHDKTSLFEHDMPILTESAKANSLMANEYFDIFRKGQTKYRPDVLLQKILFHYKLAIKNDSNFHTAYNNAGVVYYNYLKDLTSAKQYFHLAIKLRPNYSQAYINLGDCYKQEGKLDSAFNCYKKALQINPKQYIAYSVFIKMLYEQKQYKKAMAVYKVASIYFPNDYYLIGQYADCYFMLGDKKKALQEYEKAYAISPSSQLATYLYTNYTELGDNASAGRYKNK